MPAALAAFTSLGRVADHHRGLSLPIFSRARGRGRDRAWCARHRQIAYLTALAHERFTPPELIEQAKAAEAAGFDGICCSDHLAPWWAPGEPGARGVGQRLGMARRGGDGQPRGVAGPRRQRRGDERGAGWHGLAGSQPRTCGAWRSAHHHRPPARRRDRQLRRRVLPHARRPPLHASSASAAGLPIPLRRGSRGDRPAPT
jgi:hypothetical protein